MLLPEKAVVVVGRPGAGEAAKDPEEDGVGGGAGRDPVRRREMGAEFREGDGARAERANDDGLLDRRDAVKVSEVAAEALRRHNH